MISAPVTKRDSSEQQINAHVATGGLAKAAERNVARE